MPAESCNSLTENRIPFSFFSALVRGISLVKPTSPHTKRQTGKQLGPRDYPALKIVESWVEELHKKFSPIPAHTTSIFFRFLFPEEDIQRRYDIQEARMARLLAEFCGVEDDVFEKWGLDGHSGCLGQELRFVFRKISSISDDDISRLTITEVDTLLDELASKSGYSHHFIRSKYPRGSARPQFEVIKELYGGLSSEDASVITQIILKDLRPLLYPTNEFHYTVALTKFNSRSVKMLMKEHVMDAWDKSKRMSEFYRMRANLNEAAAFVDLPTKNEEDIHPLLHHRIAFPKSEKGLNCDHALTFFEGSSKVWAETKYDGERAQIHVEAILGGLSRITIFSKSGRDSTCDRHAIHSVIRKALGLDSLTLDKENPRHRSVVNAILDAEMVAFRGIKIEEFWRIRRLIERQRKVYEVPRNVIRKCLSGMNQRKSDIDDEDDLHLGLVFFDVLYLNSSPLHEKPYKLRRQILDSIVFEEPGKAILAHRQEIDMAIERPESELRYIFSAHIAARQEGLVLKADDSRYNDYRKPWVKMKKDYIPDFGDEAELLILGASWEKARGRDLWGESRLVSMIDMTVLKVDEVSPNVYTTFFVGALKDVGPKPHFYAYFTVSYGLDRVQLEDLNFRIKSSDPVPHKSQINHDLPYTITIFKGIPSPTILLRTPFVAKLIGAGYTKKASCEYYELRFPRIIQVYRPTERRWKDVNNLERLQVKAYHSVGRDRNHKDIDDRINQIFGVPSSPSINSLAKRKADADLWNKRLKKIEKRSNNVVDSPQPDWKSYNLLSPRSLFIETHSTDIDIQPLTSSSLVSSATKKSDNTITLTLKDDIFFPEGSHVWFSPASGRRCERCSTLKKFPRVHSLDTLLRCCGWTGDHIEGVLNGLIVVGECIDGAETRKGELMDLLRRLPTRLGNVIMLALVRPSQFCRFYSSARAIVYAQNGDPSQVLRVQTYPSPPSPPPNSLNIRFLLSPINPADINVVEGVYPTKPTKSDRLTIPTQDQPVFVGGNEGLARVTAVGDGVNSLSVGDWVIMVKQQAGTWATDRTVSADDVAQVPNSKALTEAQAATLTVNPPTAYNMLSDFVNLKDGDWLIQNGANSAVGQAVIQIAASKGIKTINLVRDRPDLEYLVQKLRNLGATHVLTYDQLGDKSVRDVVKEWTGGKAIQLGLNCVGGKDTTAMVRLLGNDAHLVSYGAMAKQPLSLPISLFIFKNLTCHGFWQSQWYTQRSLKERQLLMQNLVNLIKENKLDMPDHDIVTIGAEQNDEEATQKVRSMMKSIFEGRHKKKILLKIEGK